MGTKKQRYGLRKLSIGVVSCFLGSVIYFGAGMTVSAEEAQPAATEEKGSESDVAETSADPILDESTPAEVTPAEEVTPAQEVAPAQEAAPADEENALKVAEDENDAVSQNGEVVYGGITEDDVDIPMDDPNGANIKDPKVALDYYKINQEQNSNSLMVWDLNPTITKADWMSYTEAYGVNAYIVASYVKDDETKMLVQVIEHGTHNILEEKIISNDGQPVKLESTVSYAVDTATGLWVGPGNGNRENAFVVSFNGTAMTMAQEKESFSVSGKGQVWGVGRCVYHASEPFLEGHEGDIISSVVPSPITDPQYTYYTIVDKDGVVVRKDNGDEEHLAIFEQDGYRGSDYHGSEVREFNGFDLYKESDKMDGLVRTPADGFVDGEEELVTFYDSAAYGRQRPQIDFGNKNAMERFGDVWASMFMGTPAESHMRTGAKVDYVRARVQTNVGTKGDIIMEIRMALANTANNRAVFGDALDALIGTANNTSDKSIWTTIFRSEVLKPGEVTKTANQDTPAGGVPVTYDLDGDKVNDQLAKSAYGDNIFIKANADKPGVFTGGDTSYWWIQNRRDIKTDDVQHLYKPQGTVRVHYINEDGKVIKQLVTAKGKNVTKEFSVKEATEVNDGTKVSDITYSLSKKGSSYDVNTEEYKPETIEVKDENGNVLYIYILKEVKTPTGEVTPEDVTFVHSNGETTVAYNRVDAATSGTIESATIYDVTYVYKLQGDVIVHYINEDGETIKEDVVDTPLSDIDTEYNTTDNKPKRITTEDGKVYELVEEKTKGNEEGKVVGGTTHITYVYKLLKGDVIVHYKDEEGKTIAKDVVDTKSAPTGTEYDTTDNKPEIIEHEEKEYEFVRWDDTTASEQGKVVEKTTEVTYIYRLKKGNVIVHYKDEEGNTIKETVEDTPESPTGTKYDTTDNKPQRITTKDGKVYELVPEKTEGEETGKVKKGTTEVTYVYKLVKGDVIVHYVDEDGNTIKEDVVDTPTSPTGTTYDTTDNKPQRITKDGKEYELVPVKTIGNENGKVVEGTTHVTYVYKLVKGDVIVHYIDEDGNTIAEDVEDMPLTPVGTAYDTTDHKPKTIVFNGKTYVLVPEKTLGDEQGEIYEGTVHVVYVYKLVPDPVPTPPTPTPVPPKPADQPDPKLPEPTPTPEQPPVQTGMESGVMGAVTGLFTSLGAMVAFKKKENE